MADYPVTVADQDDWKALPVPAADAIVQCQGRPIKITVSVDLNDVAGINLQPNQVVRIAAGQQARIRPNGGFGGVAVMEALS
ncbi:hypothetical protein FNJ84_17730 [Paracoccus sp. M683]|uniref:hypothetical protein n=1 Tax=Paracoccus sp. M683 TaxID=2594268 RepID=UPI00117CA592|nr:hypothetical protein [Paracoccus sp. M683]TRW94933.1 hypothetical protein FNJ84_17730 [Paracoccus sp. M683]